MVTIEKLSLLIRINDVMKDVHITKDQIIVSYGILSVIQNTYVINGNTRE
jgi:hypothetical protein